MSRFDELIEERRKKLQELKDAGIDPYPAHIPESTSLSEVHSRFDELEKSEEVIYIHGRIMSIRKQGGLIFLDIKEQQKSLQVLLKKNDLDNFDLLKSTMDPGDFLLVSGPVFTTRTGERTIRAREADIIVKSIRPLPDEWYGVKDIEERYRRRYLDMIFNSESNEVLRKRFEITAAIRTILQEDGFLEVETPILQMIAGGATATPFDTHLNALDMDLYLRVAPELFLKRLVVGGWQKIFEIGKNFRNEGIDREHNPEFTMLELYWAYQDYEGMMSAIEGWVSELLSRVNISAVEYEGEEVDMSTPWKRVTFKDIILEHAGVDIYEAEEGDLKKVLDEHKVSYDESLSKFDLADEVFKKLVRPNIKDPVYVIHLPKEISPLSKTRPEDPRETERFQLVLAGREVINGFSELNDPIDQRERMERQEELLRGGQEEVSRLDEDFIEALEYGMPPAAGIGIGIDRLVAILTNSNSLREVLLFPIMKPRDEDR